MSPAHRERFLGLFLDEARQQLNQAYRELDLFELRPQQPRTLQALMRHCHSLKGMASTMGFEPYVEMAHRMEGLVRELERRPRMWSDELTPLFHDGLDQLQKWTEAIAEGETPQRSARCETLIARFDTLLGEHPEEPGTPQADAPAEETARWSVHLALQVSTTSPPRRIVSTLKRVSRFGRVVRVRPPQLPLEDRPAAMELEFELASNRTPQVLERRFRQLAWVNDVTLTALPPRIEAERGPVSPTVWTRVAADSLDWVGDTLRELAVQDGLRRSGTDEAADTRTGYLIRRLYDRIAEMRLVPTSSLVHRLEPAVRDAVRREGKRAGFRLMGGEIGLERTLLDQLVEPLRHLVRNAVAHGIEAPDERAAAGKASTGRIELTVSRHGDRLRIELSDDGRGIDTTALRRAAVDQGALGADRAASMDEEEALRLIFLPAVTTRAKADRVAGRGAGLDVVARELQLLEGEIEVTSEPGCGSRFAIELPLRRAVVQTLVFSREGQTFGVPLRSVRRAVSSDRPPDGVEIVDLADHAAEAPEEGFLLILDEPGRALALLADEVLGRRDLWLQPLVRPFSSATYVSGAAILEHGALALMLDPKKVAAEA